MSTIDILPEKNGEYGNIAYWNARYSKEQEGATFDWFKSYADIQHIIRDTIPRKSSRILMLGCGNSKLSEEMYDDGYENIVNVDYSSVCIEQMKQRHSASRPKMEWLVMDIRDLKFDDATFDVVIDKGTMDAMMTSEGDVWDPPVQVINDCTREIDEVIRVLRPVEGIFLYITFGQPHFRKRYLQRPNTKLEIRTLGEMFHYFAYTMTMCSPTD